MKRNPPTWSNSFAHVFAFLLSFSIVPCHIWRSEAHIFGTPHLNFGKVMLLQCKQKDENRQREFRSKSFPIVLKGSWISVVYAGVNISLQSGSPRFWELHTYIWRVGGYGPRSIIFQLYVPRLWPWYYPSLWGLYTSILSCMAGMDDLVKKYFVEFANFWQNMVNCCGVGWYSMV